jgi:hypothetical protein
LMIIANYFNPLGGSGGIGSGSNRTDRQVGDF